MKRLTAINAAAAITVGLILLHRQRRFEMRLDAELTKAFRDRDRELKGWASSTVREIEQAFARDRV